MKRTFLAGLTAIALMCGAGVASADEISGRVAAIDQDAQTITLDNGMSFVLDEDTNIEGLKAGDEVLVTFQTQDGERIATGVERSKN